MRWHEQRNTIKKGGSIVARESLYIYTRDNHNGGENGENNRQAHHKSQAQLYWRRIGRMRARMAAEIVAD